MTKRLINKLKGIYYFLYPYKVVRQECSIAFWETTYFHNKNEAQDFADYLIMHRYDEVYIYWYTNREWKLVMEDCWPWGIHKVYEP